MRAAALLLLFAATALAQFKSTATLVVAPTTIVDAKGQYVDNLDPSDLVLYDNNVRQAIQVDESYTPISLVVAIQTAANSAAVLDKLGASGALFTDLLAGDRGETALVTFSDDVRTRLEFTSDSTRLKNSLSTLRVQGTGAMALDAVMQALTMLAKRPAGNRKILLMVAEKRDRTSQLKFETVLQAAQRQNVLIYWLTYSPFLEPYTAKPKATKSKDPSKDGRPLPPDMAPGSLITVFTEMNQADKPDNSALLTQTTGGRAINFLRKEALEEAIQAIGAEVHRQFILSFTPRTAKAGEFHNLRVAVHGRKDLIARTREGYWSVP